MGVHPDEDQAVTVMQMSEGFIAATVTGTVLLCLLLFLIWFFRKKLTKIWTPMRLLPVVLFFSVTVFLVPVACETDVLLSPSVQNGRGAVAVIVAALQAAKMFLVEGEYDGILTMLASFEGGAMVNWARVYYLTVSVFAPISTAAFAISFVDEVQVRLRLRFLFKKRIYAFNELSERSMALAVSIRDHAVNEIYEEQYGDGTDAACRTWWQTSVRALRKWWIRHQLMFWFTDMFVDGNETEYDLAESIKEFGGAMACKWDIVMLDKHIRSKRLFKPLSLEYYLVCEDETTNLNHAISLAQFKPGYTTVTPYLYAVAVGSTSSSILDSLNQFSSEPELYEKTKTKLSPVLLDLQKTTSLEELNRAADESLMYINRLKLFSVRRANPMQHLAWVCLRQLYAEQYETIRGEKHISLMIVGCGVHGIEFLKTAIWLYQLPGVHLEINVVDRDPFIQDKVEGQCPDIMNGSDRKEDGECKYSLRFFGGVDVMRKSFWESLRSPESVTELAQIERLCRTTSVVVALGDDDMNIDAAVHLRMLFDRLHGQPVTEDMDETAEKVRILSIVYNNSKTTNVQNDLVNFCKQPYNITFVGDLMQMYDYRMIRRYHDEQKSFKHHLRWYYNARKEQALDPVDELLKYSRYEYFRVASMAQDLHMSFFNPTTYPDYFEHTGEKKALRNEEGCKIEHRRWNAFMRSLGYVYGEERNDRAKVHNKLVPYEELPPSTKKYDS